MDIWNPILDFFFNALESLIMMFPQTTETFQAIPSNAETYIYWVGQIINVPALTTVIAIILAYELAMVTVRASLVIWKLLPFT